MTNDQPIYTGKYCTSDDVLALFEDISDTPSDALLERVIKDSEAWIETRLQSNNPPVPIPTVIPTSFETISVYHSASDILMVLYHGEEYQTQRNYWFTNAEGLLEDYIDDYLRNEATIDEMDRVNMTKHSHAKTYNQKRGRGRRWLR